MEGASKRRCCAVDAESSAATGTRVRTAHSRLHGEQTHPGKRHHNSFRDMRYRLVVRSAMIQKCAADTKQSSRTCAAETLRRAALPETAEGSADKTGCVQRQPRERMVSHCWAAGGSKTRGLRRERPVMA